MFEAIVLFCAVGVADPNQCVTAEDTRGPYETREECYSRVQEMVAGIAYTFRRVASTSLYASVSRA